MLLKNEKKKNKFENKEKSNCDYFFLQLLFEL